MLRGRATFAGLKPRDGRQEDKGEDERTQDVILPCAAPVGPEEQAFDNSQKGTHVAVIIRENAEGKKQNTRTFAPAFGSFFKALWLT